MKKILLMTLIIGLISTISYAEKEKKKKRRGFITSSFCPYSCKDEGLSKEDCVEWQEGSKCYVEDLTKGPGHRSRFVVPQKNYN